MIYESRISQLKSTQSVLHCELANVKSSTTLCNNDDENIQLVNYVLRSR